MFSGHPRHLFMQCSQCSAWREPAGLAGGEKSQPGGDLGHLKMGASTLNGNEPEAVGLQRGQQELPAWHCWEGWHGCVLGWPLKGES